MKEEQYLVDLRKQINEEQEKLDGILGLIAKENHRLNVIKTERLGLSRSLDTFTKQELEFSLTKIKESRVEMESYLKEHKSEIDFHNKLEKKLHTMASELKKREEMIEGKEKGFGAEREAMDEAILDLQNSLKRITIKEEIVDENREKWKDLKEGALILFAKAKRKFDESVTHFNERSKILVEKEKIVEGEMQIAKHKQHMADVAKLETKKEWIKIEDQWKQLLEAKKYIDGKRHSG